MDSKLVNEIYLRRKNKVVLDSVVPSKTAVPKSNILYIGTILKNISSLGYTLSTDIIDALRKYPDSSYIEKFYFALIPILKELKGAHVKYSPMYPNFPTQVMEASECYLFINAIVHYITNGALLPVSEYKERFPLLDNKRLTVINLGTEEDFLSMIRNIISSKTSISDTDKEDIKKVFSFTKKCVPEEIPFKENVALICSLLWNEPFIFDKIASHILIQNIVKTPTDVLRTLVALSDGDISLATPTKFKNFSRPDRRAIMHLLQKVYSDTFEEEMLKYKNVWIRVAERIHPLEFSGYSKYKNVIACFQKLRNNEKIYTFNGKVAKAIKNNSVDDMLLLLMNRPGEFARKLDFLLREFPTQQKAILNSFKFVAEKVAVPVLLQVREHFFNRRYTKDLRTFFPKGSIAKVYGIEDNLPVLNYALCDAIVAICQEALINVFKTKEPLGKVFIDSSLDGYLVPFSQRSASKALKTIVRGSTIAMPEDTNTLRSFIYWKEPKGDRVDLDLSAVMYDADWKFLRDISYMNLRENSFIKACHSGDIISAPKGASEFIDIDIASADKSIRYIVLSVNSFSQVPFNTLPECFMGWMSRQYPNSGEIYDPKTVENKIDITSDTKICLPMILDLQERTIIWADISLKTRPNWYNNVRANNRGMSLMGRALTSLVKPNLYDLFSLHCKARGVRCYHKEDADIIFSAIPEEGSITPYDIDVIMSKYL